MTDVPLPEAWAQYAPLAPEPFHVDPQVLAERRDLWIEDWTETVVG